MESYSSKIYYTIILAISCLSLASCSWRLDSNGEKNSELHRYQNSDVGYSFTVPIGYSHNTDDEEGMYFGYSETSNIGHVTIQSYDNLKVSAPNYFNASCKEFATKLDMVENNKNIYTLKGKFPGYPCSVDTCDDSKYGMDQFKGRYILCSEHKGKTVLIEVNQITDNPELAEEIFKTFKWID